METVLININNIQVKAKKGITVLEAAQNADIYVPRLCSHPDLPPSLGKKPTEFVFRGQTQIKNADGGNSNQEHKGCQLCVVKIEGIDDFSQACNSIVEENMEIITDNSEIQDFRSKRLAEILSKHPHACLTCAQQAGCSREPCSTNVPVEERCCPKFGRCELQKVSEYIGIRENTLRYKPQRIPVLDNEPLIIRDYELCIGCTRCVRVCEDVRGIGALGFVISDGDTIVGSLKSTLKDSGCKFCGACVEVCPTGALTDKGIFWAERETALVPCRSTCPLGTDVPRYIRLIAEERFDEAAAVIREKAPLPTVLGRVCFHTCEEVCRRSELNDPIAICSLKRFAIEHSTTDWTTKLKPATTTDKKVAIIGSGPAGLTAAFHLATVGHSITIFESSSEKGGMLREGIPEYRLPRDILNKDLSYILAMGVDIETDVTVGKDLSFDDLKTKGYSAIFLALGAQKAKKLNLEGIELHDVFMGLDFLKDVSRGTPPKMKDNVLVIGGGNVAIDVALSALRIGAKKVQLACLESREEMPAHEWEIQEAIDENIKLNCSWGPKKIFGTNGNVEKVEFVRCSRVFDEKGNFSPTFEEGTTNTIETDMVILAIGQTTDLSGIDSTNSMQVSRTGLITVNEGNLSTNVPGIFAGGEVTKSPLSVVEAIEMGKNAASSIDQYLGGNGDTTISLAEPDASSQYFGRDEDFYDKKRALMPCTSIEDRTKGFTEIELGFNRQTAVEEAKRCLKCDMRLNLLSNTLPPEHWLDFNSKTIADVPEVEGAFQLLNESKEIIFIQGTMNLRQTLEEQFSSNIDAKYFVYEEDPMYTKKESELLQEFMQEFGKMPDGNEDLDDDLF